MFLPVILMKRILLRSDTNLLITVGDCFDLRFTELTIDLM